MRVEREHSQYDTDAVASEVNTAESDSFNDEWDDSVDPQVEPWPVTSMRGPAVGKPPRAIRPAWQRIERYRDDLLLRRQLQEIL